MKKLSFLYIVYLLIISINTSQAQDTNFKKIVTHANKQSYDVTTSAFHNKTIRNTGNQLLKYRRKETQAKIDKDPEVRPVPNDIKVDKALIASIFYNNFTEKRLKQLSDEDANILTHFYLDFNGKVLELEFTFKDNVNIAPVEIEKLEKQLQTQIKFIVNANAFKGENYVSAYYSVNFKMLLDHSPNAIYP